MRFTGRLAGESLTARVYYRCAPSAPALTWLSGAQTTDGAPFLFTQGESAFNRSLLPCQDTPSCRSTWDAVVLAQAPLVVCDAALACRRGDLHALRRREFAPVGRAYEQCKTVGERRIERLGPRVVLGAGLIS